MMEEIKVYTISAHAKQRYAERIMGKDDTVDVNRFVTTNEEKIKTDINKLIQYGEKIYSGKHASKDSKGSVIDVYLKDCWVVLADNKSNNVVTLFKVDLGLDDEFNKTYVDKMVEKLHTAQNELEEVQNVVSEESASYRTMIEECETQIKDYRTMIKNLEELCAGYKMIIDNNIVRVSKANRDVAEIVNTLIGKKEF